MDRRTKGSVGLSGIALIAAITLGVLGLNASNASADEPIVGLWEATWTDASGGPGNGSVVANVWDVWHSDGTETQNDNGPVIIGFVCQGVWTKVGKRSYFLSHPSFNYLGDDGHLDTTSSTVIFEKVTVSKDGNSFKGIGAIKGYSGIDPFDPSATLFYTFPINITAKRVIPDTSQLP
jgi:hypothetical protein